MNIAALIIGTLALVISTLSLAVLVGKFYFSSHKVQMVPMGGGDFGFDGGKSGANPYADIDEPLDEET